MSRTKTPQVGDVVEVVDPFELDVKLPWITCRVESLLSAQFTERYPHLAPESLTEGADILGQIGTVGPQEGTIGTHQQSVPTLTVVK